MVVSAACNLGPVGMATCKSASVVVAACSLASEGMAAGTPEPVAPAGGTRGTDTWPEKPCTDSCTDAVFSFSSCMFPRADTVVAAL